MKIILRNVTKKYHLENRGDNPSSQTHFMYAFLRPAAQCRRLYPWRQGMP